MRFAKCEIRSCGVAALQYGPSQDPRPTMKVLGIESSCDETGVAIYDTDKGLLAHRCTSQIDLHAAYGGVVPELASRDHIRRLPLLVRQTFADAGVEAAALTASPHCGAGPCRSAAGGRKLRRGDGLRAGPPGAAYPSSRRAPAVAPCSRTSPPAFPFVALLVSGGHTQLMRVSAVGLCAAGRDGRR